MKRPKPTLPANEPSQGQQQREKEIRECRSAINAALLQYRCTLVPDMTMTPDGKGGMTVGYQVRVVG